MSESNTTPQAAPIGSPPAAPAHAERQGFEVLKSCLESLDEHQLQEVWELVEMLEVESGTVVLREGDESHLMYLIVEGQVEIRKLSDDTEEVLHLVGPGSWVGEMGLIDGDRRSASVVARGPTTLLEFTREDLDELAQRNPRTFSRFMYEITEQVGAHMRRTTDELAEQLALLREANRMRVAMGTFTCTALLIACGYSFLLRITAPLIEKAASSSLVTTPVMLLTCVAMLVLMRRTGYPLSLFGLSTRDWLKHSLQALWWTLPVLVAMTLGKWVAISLVERYADLPLFHFSTILAGKHGKTGDASLTKVLILAVGYAVVVPLQEFFTRGAFQGPLAAFLTGRSATWMAILITNTVFCTVHLHMSLTFSAIVFLPGLFWGWIYSRQGTLVGVTISHILIGLWAFFGLGLTTLLKL